MLLDDLATVLTSGAIGFLGTTQDWSITLGQMPEYPDRAIMLTQTGGFGTVYGLGARKVERPRVQAILRAPMSSYSTGQEKITEVYAAFDGLTRVINGVSYLRIEAVQPPFNIGIDKIERPLFVVNFDVMRHMTSSM